MSVDGSGSMGAGFSDIGTMNIYDGIVVESTYGYIGYNNDSTPFGQNTRTNTLTDNSRDCITWQARVFGRDGCQPSTAMVKN
jgi:hypothetical protein